MGEEDRKGKGEKTKCPKCDSELHHVEKVDQHYCFNCETYYSHEDVEKAKAKEEPVKQAMAEAAAIIKDDKLKPKGIPCPSCGDTTAPVKDSDSYYCYACEQYFTKGGKVLEEKEEAAEETKPAEVEAKAVIEEAKPAAEEKPVVVEVKPAVVETKPAVAETKPAEAKEIRAERAAEIEKRGEMKSELTVEETMILNLLEGNKEEKEDKRICPSCGLALTYVQKYDRWYCYTCRKYANKEASEEGEEEEKEAMLCSECGGKAEYIEKYDRWYCRSCKRYLPTVKAAAAAKEAKAEKEEAEETADGSAPLCAQCGKPTTWIANYERYYCYPCKKYAPKGAAAPAKAAAAEEAKPLTPGKPAGPACATCGRPTSWIAKYNRYYCYHCQKYAPKTEGKTEAKAEAKAETKPAEKKPATPLCSTCGKPTTWIAKYERYYCYPCKKYAPK
jgi:ribosomal protein S27AE